MSHQVSGGKKGEKLLTNWQWYEFVERKAHCGRLWKMMGKEQYKREMWEYCCRERLRVKTFREEAQKERQAGIHCQWQHESPARENLEQVKCSSDNFCTDNDEAGLYRLKSEEWEEQKTPSDEK